MARVSGTIQKINATGGYNPLYTVRSLFGDNYSLYDNHKQLAGARVDDYIEVTITPIAKNNRFIKSYELVELLDYNRPFSVGQLVESAGTSKSKLESTLANSNQSLGRLVDDSEWDQIKWELKSLKLTPQRQGQLLKHFQKLFKERQRFTRLKVTNHLIGQQKCGLTDEEWHKFKRLVGRLIASVSGADSIINQIDSSPYELLYTGRLNPSTQSFHLIDKIAKNGTFCEQWRSDHLERQKTAVWSTLIEMVYDSQHCFIPLDLLLTRSRALIGFQLLPNIEKQLNQAKVYTLTNSKGAVTKIVYPQYLDRQEQAVAEKLNWFQPPRLEITLDQIKSIDPHLDSEQERIIQTVGGSSITVLTGPPGVGKTRLIVTLAKLFKLLGHPLLLSAPTGLACKNIERHIPDFKVYTIAKLLYRISHSAGGAGATADGADGADGDGADDCDYLSDDSTDNALYDSQREITDCLLKTLTPSHYGIIIDETSMMDISQTYQLISRLPKEYFVVLVGDPNQLSSIGPGQVLKDIIRSGRWPVLKLTNNYRQKSGSQVISNALSILDGQTKLVSGKDFRIAETGSDGQTLELVEQLIEHLKGAGQLDDTVILTPYNKKTVVSANNLNQTVKKYFNAGDSGRDTLSVGDRVLQTKNDPIKGLVNGDIGIISDIKYRGGGGGQIEWIVVDFWNGADEPSRVKYRAGEVRKNLQLAYALTIHKSQGNGYNHVIVVVPHGHHTGFFNQNMLYTAVTRAKVQLFLVGANPSYIIRSRAPERNTRLAQRLKSAT